jgi:hypothetical protein
MIPIRCALFAWPAPLPLITVSHAKRDSNDAAAFCHRIYARTIKRRQRCATVCQCNARVFGANTASMKYKVIYAIAAGIGIYLFCSQTMLAAPMRCSGEHQVCASNCTKSTDRDVVSTCVANCRARQATCMQTGCWDNGMNKYCGLTRQ